MFTINIEKEKLLGILEKNKLRHIKIYNEMIKLCRKNYVNKLKKMIKGKKILNFINIDIPVSNESDYSEIIKMLKLSCDKIVALDEQNYKKYVLDKWHWTSSFISTIMSNATTSSSSSSSVSTTTSTYLTEMKDEEGLND